jgi:predicted metal-dependent phosphoesterase TrpH
MLKNLDPNTKIDLHMHTTASDGSWSPERMVNEIRIKGINVFSVTDHDTVENIKKVQEIIKGEVPVFIPGVEINTSRSNHNYHILGYFIDINNEYLQRLIENNRDILERKDTECIKYLEESGMKDLSSEYQNYENNRERGGWKALNFSIDKGLCSSCKEFFKLFEKFGNPFEQVNFPSPHEVIEAINDAGGVAVLAHPGATFYGGDYKEVVSYMIGQGIQGIECYHPENNQETTDYCLESCRKHELIITGGSDCHGDFVKTRSLGTPEIRLGQLKLF